MQDNRICAVLLSDYDGAPQNKAVFCRLLREWYGGKRRQSGREHAVENGKEISYVYRLTKRDLRWEKRCGSLMLEEAAPEEYGWSIVTRSFEGDVVSKIRLDHDYHWLQTAYFDNGFTGRTSVCLRPAQDGKLEMVRWDTETDAYRTELLTACELPQGGLSSLVNAEAGEPPVLAELVNGRVGYCPPEQAARRAAVLEQEKDHPLSMEVPTAGESDDALDRFEVIDNTVHPVLPVQKKPKKEIAAPKESDYAVNREIGFFEEEPIIETAPRPVERIRIDDDVNAKAVSALLDEVSNARKGEGKPSRYTVAARGSAGTVQSALKEKKPEGLPPEQEPILLPSLKAVKQIVVSAEESYLYFGGLQDGKRTGRGRTQMENGCTAYEGDYQNDRRDGFGVYYYKSGKLCYAGHWKQNAREGAGVAFSSRDGSLFAGRWKDNVPTGLGAAFDPDGNLIYTGEWKDGKRHGHGTEYRDGKILFTGEWEAGRPVKGFRRID